MMTKKELDKRYACCYDSETGCITIDRMVLWLDIEQALKDVRVDELSVIKNRLLTVDKADKNYLLIKHIKTRIKNRIEEIIGELYG